MESTVGRGEMWNESVESVLRDAKTTCNDSYKIEEEILPETSGDRNCFSRSPRKNGHLG